MNAVTWPTARLRVEESMPPKRAKKEVARPCEVELEPFTPTEIKDLRSRMKDHTSVNDMAVCVVTARELQRLIDIVEAVSR